MPPPKKNGGGSGKKKKKGHAPAHQNTFAFQHNPKSKKTDRILNSPNQHVCRRCHEKIEWRKKYRKYKPRTQPGKCNLCQKRNVVASYHTICTSCTTSDRARQQVLQSTTMIQAATTSANGNNGDEMNESLVSTGQGENDDEVDNHNVGQQPSPSEPNEPSTDTVSTASSSKATTRTIHRVCAICVKDPALPDTNDKNDDNSLDALLAKETRRISLRERKAMERRIEREKREVAAAKEAARQERRRARLELREQQQQQQAQAGVPAFKDDEESGSSSDDWRRGDTESIPEQSSDDDEQDPFLQAIGGADKLLVGEAYQQMLLARSKQAAN